MKYRIATVSLLLLLGVVGGVSADSLAEAEKWLEASVVRNGVVMSPPRYCAAVLGTSGGRLSFGDWSKSNIRFNADNGRSLLLRYGLTLAWRNDEALQMPVAPIYVKWRAYGVRSLVPVRWVVETLGGQVSYDAKTRKVTLTGPRGTVSFIPRGTLQKPDKMYYLIAGKRYLRDDFLRGTIYFPLGEFEALGGQIPADCQPLEKINDATCAPLKMLLQFNGGRMAMEWVNDAIVEIVLWMPQTGEIRTPEPDQTSANTQQSPSL